MPFFIDVFHHRDSHRAALPIFSDSCLPASGALLVQKGIFSRFNGAQVGRGIGALWLLASRESPQALAATLLKSIAMQLPFLS